MESAPRPGDDAVPVDATPSSVGVVLRAHELLEVESVCVVVPNFTKRPSLPRWRWTALGSAPLLDMATTPMAPRTTTTAANTRSFRLLNMVHSRPCRHVWRFRPFSPSMGGHPPAL